MGVLVVLLEVKNAVLLPLRVLSFKKSSVVVFVVPLVGSFKGRKGKKGKN